MDNFPRNEADSMVFCSAPKVTRSCLCLLENFQLEVLRWSSGTSLFLATSLLFTYYVMCHNAVIGQSYDVYVEMEHAVLGNDAIFKCKLPSHMSDLVTVTGWMEASQEEQLRGNPGGRKTVPCP